MALNEQEIISSDPAGQDGEGPADGGANPLGRDGGADGGAEKEKPHGEGLADGGANPAGQDGGADGGAE
ncbi:MULTISPECIES: hypothetical protein [unclassified Actinoplanes]|uniref:hypothetical protein n=1 Tax=unclassified Actinoplanes TaxID=2626549 RepID=UPI0002F4D1B3|nr:MULTISPECIES: hypothetical protein [unclassified Actinoplanes]SLM00636.1 hypothetical protein ACSP50_3869 [Actinoplanes sp. SE50/110]